MYNQKGIAFIHSAILMVLLYLVFHLNFTGDSGDSIMHYLFAKYAFKHPENLLHHWAKPIFTLLSAPFAQFGFKGIEVMNVFLAVASSWITVQISRQLKQNHNWMLPILIFFAPMYTQLVFSGLTEYMFGCGMLLGTYLALRKKYFWAVLIISFLPFIRSEGLLIIGLFSIYFIIKKQFKLMPALAIGHFVYSIIGFFYYENLFWVFTEIPYASWVSKYGHGEIWNFAQKLNEVIEKPIYLFLAIGLVTCFIVMFRQRKEKPNWDKTIIIYGSFGVIFMAHSIFWWKGMFHSMGLPRVLIPIVPFIAIIALEGITTIIYWLKKKWLKKTTLVSILCVIIIIPFTNRKKGVVWAKEDFSLAENNLFEKEIKPSIVSEIPNYKSYAISSAHPYVMMSLDIDIFDTTHFFWMSELEKMKGRNKQLIIWDAFAAPLEGGIQKSQLDQNNKLTRLTYASQKTPNRFLEFAVYANK